MTRTVTNGARLLAFGFLAGCQGNGSGASLGVAGTESSSAPSTAGTDGGPSGHTGGTDGVAGRDSSGNGSLSQQPISTGGVVSLGGRGESGGEGSVVGAAGESFSETGGGPSDSGLTADRDNEVTAGGESVSGSASQDAGSDFTDAPVNSASSGTAGGGGSDAGVTSGGAGDAVGDNEGDDVAGDSDGGAPDGGGSPDAPSLVGRAFDVQMPDSVAGSGCAGTCSPATVLVTAETDTTLEIVWGSIHRADSAVLMRDASGWVLTEPLVLGGAKTWEYALCSDQSTLETALFDFGDYGAEGSTDLVITGHEVSRICSDDYQTESDSDLTLIGTRDERLPTVIVPEPFEPLHGLSLDLDKPLAATATAALVPDGGGSAVPLVPRLMEGYVVGFDTDIVLPLGSRYEVQVVGSDFAGVGSPPNVGVAVLESFGTLVEDGFESQSSAGIHEAEIVSSYSVPAIAGDSMLYVAPGAHALLALERAEGDDELVMDTRRLNECPNVVRGDGSLEVAVAVVGTAEVTQVTTSMGTATPGESAVFGEIDVGELATLTVPISEPGNVVLVYVHGDYYVGAGCSRVGLLLDNVGLR